MGLETNCLPSYQVNHRYPILLCVSCLPKFPYVSCTSAKTSDQIRSVTQWCPTLCNPMNRSTPGLPVHHQLLEFPQTHVCRVNGAIQPSHPLSSPSPRVFSNESTLHMRWPKYWSLSFSISPSKEHPGLISFTMVGSGWISLQSKGLTRVFFNTTIQKHQFFGAQLSSQSNSHIHT